MSGLPIPPWRPTPVAVIAVAAGAGAGAAAVAAVLLPPAPGAVLAGLVLCIGAWAAVGDPRPALLALLAFDLPLQLDVNLGYQTEDGAFGAFGGVNVSITTFALSGLLLAELVGWCMGERRQERGRRVLIAFAAYVAVAGVSVLWARDRFLTMAWALLLVQSLLLLWVLVRVVRSRDDVQRLVGFLLAGLLVEGLLIIYQAVSGADSLLGLSLTAYQPGTGPGPQPGVAAAGARVGGTLGSPNLAAAYLSVLLPLALAVVLAQVPRRMRVLAGTAFGLGVTALLFGTVSRGGVLALLIGCGLVIAVAVRRGWLSGTGLLALGAVLTVVGLGAGGALIARVQSDAGAAQGRVPLLSLATGMFRDHPLQGVGANNFVPALPDYLTARYTMEWIYVVHNDYLLVAAELGLVGLLAYAFFLVRLVRHGVQAIGRAADAFLGPVATGCLAGIAGRLAHMNVDVFNGRPQVQSLVTVTALLIAAGALVPAAERPDLPTRRTSCAA